MSDQPTAPQIETSLKTEGQRHVNLMWERTQAIIAIAVTLIVLSVCSIIVVSAMLGNVKQDGANGPLLVAMAVGAFQLLSNVFFLVVGSYFNRTNHTKSSSIPGAPEDHR